MMTRSEMRMRTDMKKTKISKGWFNLAKFLWQFEGFKIGLEQMLDERLGKK